jgi:hypothetical protein
MSTLADWIEYGLKTTHAGNKRMVRRWLAEHRDHKPVIDRVTYPETGIDRRIVIGGRRAGDNR